MLGYNGAAVDHRRHRFTAHECGGRECLDSPCMNLYQASLFALCRASATTEADHATFRAACENGAAAVAQALLELP